MLHRSVVSLAPLRNVCNCTRTNNSRMILSLDAVNVRTFTSSSLVAGNDACKKSWNGNGRSQSQALLHSNTNSPTGVGQLLLFRNISLTGQKFAARKGTRERKAKKLKKAKKEIIKKSFMERLAEKKASIAHAVQRPPDNSNLPEPLDDVYFYERFQDKIWPFTEAVENHREVHHPTMRNTPRSALIIRIDIDLVYPNRPAKMMDTWKTIVEMKYPFLLPGMSVPKIIAFCTNDINYINEVLKSGADNAGSNELIKSIQEGNINVNDYEHVIAHPLMVAELTAIRGLLKRKFPTIKSGLLNVDLCSVVQKLKSGLKVQVQTTSREPDFAWIETPIGKLDMPVEELEANFEAILTDTLPRRVAGKPPAEFIVQCSLKSSHTLEKFIIDKEYYISKCDSVSVKKIVEKKEKEAKKPAETAEGDEAKLEEPAKTFA